MAAETIGERIAEIRDRVAAAAQVAGRAADAITLIGISKRQPVEAVRAAVAAGLCDLGENTAQGLTLQAERLGENAKGVRWHFVGSLQRNKARQVLKLSNIVHSVDSDRLARELSKQAIKLERTAVEVLVQVNLGGETQKGGVAPEAAVDFACGLVGVERLRLRGLMAIPPRDHDPSRHFATLAELSQRLQSTTEGASAGELSMGMSQDFELAIRNGATMVRVGTSLFGERLSPEDWK